MKNIALYLFLFLIPAILHAQWQPDVRLTSNPANSYLSGNNVRGITSEGLIVHVVWHDNRDGNYEIYYKRSADWGVSWEPDTRLTDDPASSYIPSIAVSGQVVHVVWYEERAGNPGIFYKRSPDAGVSWGADMPLTVSDALLDSPCIAISGQVVHVLWHDYRDGNPEIYYKRSEDGGGSWGVDTRLTNNADYSKYPSLSVAGSSVHVTWMEDRDGNREIYHRRSADGGTSWGEEMRLTDDNEDSFNPSVAVSGQVVHVAWYDRRDGNFEIYYKCSVDGGTSWGADNRLTNDGAASYSPSLAISGPVAHVVWSDERNGNREIYYKSSADAGLSWCEDMRLTNNTAESTSVSMCVSDPAVHIVWQDNRDGNYEIYYKRNPSGDPAGIPDEKNSGTVKVYPNPSSGNFRIEWIASENTETKIEMLNLLGEKVWEKKLSTAAGPNSIIIKEIIAPGGLYFLRITDLENQIIRKVIIQ